MRAAVRTSWWLAVLLALLLAVSASGRAAGPVTHFALSFRVTSTTAGASVTGRIDPVDDMGNSLFFVGVVHFTSSDPLATLPADEQLTGAELFFATFRTAGPQTITATLLDGSLTGTSPLLPVDPAAVSRFTIAVPPLATTGVPLTFTVTARDRFRNEIPTYAGTVRFTSSDASASLPPDTQLTGGSGDFTATLRAGGTRTITATDIADASLAGTAAIPVARPATRLQLAGPVSTLAGFPAVVGARALDATGALAFTYDGTVHFSSSDPQAVLPADVTLVNGQASALATFNTTGLQTISAADTTKATLAGTSPQLLVGVVDDPGQPPAPPPPAPPAPAPPAPPPPPSPSPPVPSAPAVRDLVVKPLCVRRPRLLSAPRTGRGALRVSFSSSAAARVSVSVERLVHAKAPARCPRTPGSTKGAVKLVRTLSGSASAGRDVLAVAAGAGRRSVALAAAAKALTPGAYVVQVRATDAAGRRSAPATAKFFVLR
jgi:hypothetical protein